MTTRGKRNQLGTVSSDDPEHARLVVLHGPGDTLEPEDPVSFREAVARALPDAVRWVRFQRTGEFEFYLARDTVSDLCGGIHDGPRRKRPMVYQ